MRLSTITPMIITFNEAENIGRVLEKLSWATQILIIDSGSTDATLSIIARYEQARVVNRPFDNFADQCNFGLSLVESSWVLSLDADYELSDEFAAELYALDPGDSVSGFRASFIYRINGFPLRGTLYPARTVLYRPDRARYYNEGHGHRVSIDGAVGSLKSRIFHDDRKPLRRWFSSQQRYAEAEAIHLLAGGEREARWPDRIRVLAWPAPILVFLYTLFVKGCILDGWPGWLYVLQRTLAEAMIACEIVNRMLVARQGYQVGPAVPTRSDRLE